METITSTSVDNRAGRREEAKGIRRHAEYDRKQRILRDHLDRRADKALHIRKRHEANHERAVARRKLATA